MTSRIERIERLRTLARQVPRSPLYYVLPGPNPTIPKPRRAIHTLRRCSKLWVGHSKRRLLPTMEIGQKERDTMIADGRWWKCKYCGNS